MDETTEADFSPSSDTTAFLKRGIPPGLPVTTPDNALPTAALEHPGPPSPPTMATAAPSRATQVHVQPSKEWVIPPKPKPGRKPKMDDVPKVPDPKDGDLERKVLNRAAQRAFRERKQSQLADLHARIQAYEAGELEKSVHLQKVSQQVKDENNKLKKENADLKDEVRRLRDRIEALEGGQGRGRSDDRMSIDLSPRIPKKRQRRSSDISPVDSRMSSRETAASSDTAASATSSSYPQSSSPPTSDNSMATPTPIKTNMTSPTMAMMSTPIAYASATAYQQTAMSEDIGGCGFCTSTSTCLCVEVSQSGDSFSQQALLQPSPVEEKAPISSVEYVPYQPAVPIRLRSDRSQPSNGLKWVLDSKPALTSTPAAASSSSSVPVGSCSGDPSNCPACANDAFGRDFCSRLGAATCSRNPCPGCPSRTAATSSPYGSVADQSSNPSLLCCGDPSFCGPLKLCSPTEPSTGPAAQSSSMSYPSYTDDEDTIPADEAWRTIKRHPGLPLTSLDLLAEVVARRTTCAGPSSAQSTSRPPPGTWAFGRTLVPQEELIEAGRRRRMMVHRDGLQEALDILNEKFSGSR